MVSSFPTLCFDRYCVTFRWFPCQRWDLMTSHITRTCRLSNRWLLFSCRVTNCALLYCGADALTAVLYGCRTRRLAAAAPGAGVYCVMTPWYRQDQRSRSKDQGLLSPRGQSRLVPPPFTSLLSQWPPSCRSVRSRLRVPLFISLFSFLPYDGCCMLWIILGFLLDTFFSRVWFEILLYFLLLFLLFFIL